jgi:threonine aldolase
VIAAILRPYQGVLSANTGHINVHETGAIEATGHKVLALPSEDGKITAAQVQDAYDNHWTDGSHEHIVQQGMVYISHPTENGTLYTKDELKALYETCQKLELPLFMDGARLGYGLMAECSDLTWKDIAEYTDVFYIGGTKVGALFGEAVVITNPALTKDFRYMIKQHGGMLAKGWLLGLQLEALLEKDLYFTLSRQANEHADTLRSALTDMGYDFLVETSTNQLFPVLPDAILPALSEDVTFIKMDAVGEAYHAVRFCTSWATTAEDVEFLCRLLYKLSK